MKCSHTTLYCYPIVQEKCEIRTIDSSAKKVIKVENQSVDDNESKDQHDAQSTDEVFAIIM